MRKEEEKGRGDGKGGRKDDEKGRGERGRGEGYSE